MIFHEQVDFIRAKRCDNCDDLLQICGALAIVEKDYFGLQYKRSGFRHWLNLRNDIERQVKSSPPYRFELRVKYFIEPEHIQQESTRYIAK